MSLEQAIQDSTKVLQSIATSLAVLAAKGTLRTDALTPDPKADVKAEAKADVKAEAKAEKPKAEAKPKAEPKADKPIAEKTDQELMAEVLSEDAAIIVDEDDDLLGSEAGPAAYEPPKLPAGIRNTEYAKVNLLPTLSKLGREQVVEILGAGKKISDIPTDQWDELFEKGCRLLHAAGKL